MSREVIGMEGTRPDDAVVVWGAAALRDGETLINTHTGLTAPLSAAERLSDDRHLFLFDAPIEVRDEYGDAPLIVVMVNLQSPKRDPFLADTGRLGGLIEHRHAQGWQHYVFADPESFGRYAASVANEVISDVLYSTEPFSNESRELIRLALTLAPDSPDLNAVRVHLAGNNNLVERLARASLRSADGLSRFDLLLKALRGGDAEYQLKYEDGAATGGGFDVDVAVKTLHAIQLAHNAFRKPLRATYQFVREFPPPRFHQMQAASAELHFVPSIKNRPLGEKVARYLSLHFLEDSLRGQTPAHVPKSRELKDAIRRISQPSRETRLSQKRLSQNDREDVTYVPPAVGPVERSEVLKVLGIVSGIERDYTAELSIFPKWRLSVNTRDNGAGEQPVGVEATRGPAFLRRPFVLSLVREIEDEVETFRLIEMRMMAPGVTDQLTAIPSSVVEEALMTGLDLRIEWPADSPTLLIENVGAFEEAATGSLASFRRFLKLYAERCADFELGAHPIVVSWLPSPEPVTTAIGRVLVALHELGGEAPVSDVVGTISNFFGKPIRINNTRREVLRHPDLLEFHPDDDKVMRWTTRGRAFYEVYVAAGGRTDGMVD